MNTDQLISKAIHCLNTGQPNLAKLYMRKAHQQIKLRRQELKSEIRSVKYRQLETNLGVLGAVGARVTDAMQDFANAFTGIVPPAALRTQIQSSHGMAASSA